MTADRSYAKTCKRCGAMNLRWTKSTRKGPRPYLCETTGTQDVCGAPIPFKPHKCPPVGERRQIPAGVVEFTGSEWKIVAS